MPGPLAVRATLSVAFCMTAHCAAHGAAEIIPRCCCRQASKIRWDTATRARAEAAVQRAIRNWREQEQQHGER